MMRSKRHRAMSPGQWLAHNPFLAVAILAGLALGALKAGVGNERFMEMAWLTLGYGFHATATFLSRVLPDLPAWMAIMLTAVAGLLVYLLLDSIWRRLKPQ